MSSINKENQNGYDIWSEFYDSYLNPTVAIDDIHFPREYGNIRHQNVLEIGCGTGRHTKRLIEADNQVTGIDISSGMLTQLRQKIKSSKLTLIQGDFLNEKLVNQPFDAIVLSLVLEHIPDLVGFFIAAKNALKIGGAIYLSEIHPDRTAVGTFAHFKKSDGQEIHLKSSAHTSAAIQAAAVQAGFEVEKMMSISGDSELASLNPKWEKYNGQPMIQIWKMKLTVGLMILHNG